VMVRRMVVPLRQQAAVERAPAGVTVKTTSPMAHFEAETPSDPPASTRSRSGDLPSGRPAQG
jgi:hypothetical protein